MVTIRGDPVYAVTKAYGLRSYLLSPSALEELAYVKNLGDFVDILRPTNYGPFLPNSRNPTLQRELREHCGKASSTPISGLSKHR